MLALASRRRIPLPLPLLAAGVVVAALLAVATGSTSLSVGEILRALLAGVGLGEVDPVTRAVVLDVRVPRVALGLAVGAALATAGALMQAIFRNPLAEPALVGVSSGSALGAAAVIVAGDAVGLPTELEALALPLAAALGGGVTTLLVVRLARRGGHTATATLLLAGLAVTAFVNAVLGLALHLADDAELRSLTFWMLGSLGGARPGHILLALPFLLVPVGLALRLASGLDALLLGEVEARHLGVDVEQLKRRAVTLAALMVGAAVALSGVIGFVGLLVPHLVRIAIGPSHGPLLVRAALGGSALLVLADLVARTAAAPVELPIGVLTALLGAPFFLWLLVGRASEAAR